jgi:hypothetical protein
MRSSGFSLERAETTVRGCSKSSVLNAISRKSSEVIGSLIPVAKSGRVLDKAHCLCYTVGMSNTNIPAIGSFTVTCKNARGEVVGHVGGSTIHSSWDKAITFYRNKTRSQIRRGLIRGVATATLIWEGTSLSAPIAL